MSTIALKKVTKTFAGGAHAVHEFDLTIAHGEFVVLVGPSGCGKSTVLRLIAGLEEVTSGEIEIDGRVVNEIPPKDRDVAMVFQNYALYPHMTVFDNMAFGLKMRNEPAAAIREKVSKAAGILGLQELIERKPKSLSGGQRQRVALGRAIVRDPKCFLFDEPLSNLDAGLRLEMRIEIKRLHLRLRSTSIYVTHDQEEAMTLGDRVVVLRNGQIQQSGPPLEIYRQPANRFVAGFLGTPPMNFLNGRLHSRDGRLWFESDAGNLIMDAWSADLAPFEGAAVVAGVRPQALRLEEDRANPGNRFDGVVQLCEPLGDKMNVYLSTGGVSIVAHVDSRPCPPPGQAIAVAVNTRQVHLFEPGDAGRNLHHVASPAALRSE